MSQAFLNFGNCEVIYLEPIALIGHDAVLTRERRINARRRRSTHSTMVKAGRCRWKIENECFNTLKNQGYCIEHNYGHGEKNLSINFYLLTLIAFSFHQVFELTDKLYQECRKHFGSKMHLWENLRSMLRMFIFDIWEFLLAFALHPENYNSDRPVLRSSA